MSEEVAVHKMVEKYVIVIDERMSFVRHVCVNATDDPLTPDELFVGKLCEEIIRLKGEQNDQG